MIIKDLFEKDINRSINGVVKVSQEDEESLRQELSEYVVTRELRRHFSDFFNAYCSALDVPTDKIGVWILGFFGSGKSHFLKMLSYLLSNATVGGMPASSYFAGKFDDPLLESNVLRATSVPTESILFNIDAKGGHWKEGDTARTALLRSFQRVFYEHRGFFGYDLRLAKLESFIDAQGKTKAFRGAFESINGASWLESRDSYEYFEEDIIDALVSADVMGRGSAEHWFDGGEDASIPLDRFVDEVAAYADARAEQEGGDFRLLFMADEVGQFIGSDVSLMLSLQSLVEEIGAKCKGRVWVMVTSQEAIDEVVMVVGNDFSKIQGRFNTRLSLSSSSVDEVIKRRVLQKTSEAASVLQGEFAQKSAVLKNLFSFEDSRGDLIGYASERDFAETYPFAGYQFKVLPNVMTEIRKHGISAKHMSTGERSMLSAFQESAQSIQERGCTALVPFWRFFDTISKDLDHGVIQVVERCRRAAEDGAGVQLHDVQVLKLLYLIRYINDIKPTARNIAILMADDIDADLRDLRERVKESLDRLVRQNYVARQGDCYNFLTDEEQDIARAIRETDIDMAAVTEQVKRIVFEEIFTGSKLRSGKNDFPFDRYVDDDPYGQSRGGMKLNIITAGHDLSQASAGELALKSAEQALVVLSDETDYYDAIQGAVKIRKYVRTQNVQQLPASTQRIIAQKQREAAELEREAKGLIEEALRGARCAVDGQTVQLGGGSARQVLEGVLERLASAVFSKADLVDAPVEGDADVLRILKGTYQLGMGETAGGSNERAAQDMLQYLTTQRKLGFSVTMAEVQRKYQAKPYGWREVDVAAVMARLFADQQVRLYVGGAALAADDRRFLDSLRSRGAEKATVELREKLSEHVEKKVRETLRSFAPDAKASNDEDGLVAAVVESLEMRRDQCRELLANSYGRENEGYPYPGRTTVAEGLRVVEETLKARADSHALLRAFADAQDDLLGFAEDMDDYIAPFFERQRDQFDAAVRVLSVADAEQEHLAGDDEARAAAEELRGILGMPQPYRRVPEIAGLCKQLEAAHERVMRVRRQDLLDRMKDVASELAAYAAERLGDDAPDDERAAATEVLAAARDGLEQRQSQVHGARDASQLDAQAYQLGAWRDKRYRAIDEAIDAARAKRAAERVVPTRGSSDDGVVTKRIVDDDAGKGATGAQVPTPAKSEKTLRASDVCPPKRLETPQDVDAYVEAIRSKLLKALEENDAVRLG